VLLDLDIGAKILLFEMVTLLGMPANEISNLYKDLFCGWRLYIKYYIMMWW